MFSAVQVKNSFKRLGIMDGYDFHLKAINVNGQKRGCSGFIVNKANDKICYISTEPHFSWRSLWQSCKVPHV